MTKLTINIGELTRDESEFTVDQFIATLEATTTLTHLEVVFDLEENSNDPRFVKQLGQCISNLKRRNENHPLVTIELTCTEEYDVLDDLLMAAKQFGIRHLKISNVGGLPVDVLVHFCRNNSNLKVLEIRDTSFYDEEGDISFLPSHDGTRDSAVIVALDKLVLEIFFENSTAATNFADLVARMSASELELFSLTYPYKEVNGDICDEFEVTRSIMSRMQLPSAEKLTLTRKCLLENFRAALDTGTTVQLDVAIDFDQAKASEKTNILTSFIRGAVKLRSLTIRFHSDIRNWRPPVAFFQAVEACATVTTIQVCATAMDSHSPSHIHLSQREQHQLQRIATRNVELGRFVASPSTYPTEQLLTLLGQFNNCPSGLYMLTSRLPVVFSFDKLRARMLPKKRKHNDMDTTEVAQLREHVFQVTSKLERGIELLTSKLDRAIELLNVLTQQHPKERATPMQNGNEDRLGIGGLLHDNTTAPESAATPHAQVTGYASADETPLDQQEQGTVER